MKRALEYVFVLAVIAFSSYSLYSATLSPCEKPLKYSIGRFDERFGVQKEEFKSLIAEAETVWEKPLRRDVFIYDPSAKFKVNLIYDERQITTFQKQRTESGLSAIEETFKKLDRELASFKRDYEQKVAAYDLALAAFQQRKAAYDKEVSFWNERGGAPAGKFDALESERRYLNSEMERLNAEVVTINSMARQLNSMLGVRNSKASEYNRAAEDYNQKYSAGLEFNQAEYNGREINIYQFANRDDLLLALTHELGHALGMDHVEGPDSIMYYITGFNSETSITPSVQDMAELKKVCK